MRYQSKPKHSSEGKTGEIRFQMTPKITRGWLSFPGQKGVTQADHKGNKVPHSLKTKSELMRSWPWRKHHVRTWSDPKVPFKVPQGRALKGRFYA